MQKVPFFTRVNSSPNDVQTLQSHPGGIKHPILQKGGSSSQSQREQAVEFNQQVAQASQSPQQLQAMHYMQKPRTSAATHRIQLLHNNEKANDGTSAPNEQLKAPLKMKVHNFDSLGLAGANIDALATQTMPLDALRASMNQLHIGNVQTKNLFLNTIQPYGGQSNIQGFSSPMMQSQGSKNKMFPQQPQFPSSQAIAHMHKNLKIIQQIPPNQIMRAQSNQQQLRQQRHIYAQRKILNNQYAQQQQQSNPGQQQPQIGIISRREIQTQQTQSTPGILQSMAIESKGQHPLIQTAQNGKTPFSGRISMQLRGQSQNCQRRTIEDKNLKIFSNAIQSQAKMFDVPPGYTNHVKNKISQGSSSNAGQDDYDNVASNVRMIENEESAEGFNGIAGGSPSAVHRYSNFEYNSSSVMNLQIARGNSEPGFQRPSEFMSAISNTDYQDQIATQIQNHRTEGTAGIVTQSTAKSPAQMKYPIKNTQGLQGSIYSSSATSSIEGDNIILLNDSNDKYRNAQQIAQNSPIDHQFIMQRDEQQAVQQQQKRLVFLQQRNSEKSSSPDINMIRNSVQDYDQQPQRELHRFTLMEENKKNFASTLNPQSNIPQVLFGERGATGSDVFTQLQLQQSKSTKKPQRQIISKNNIKFASSNDTNNNVPLTTINGGTTTSPLVVANSSSALSGVQTAAIVENNQQQINIQDNKGAEEMKVNQKKTLSKLREAQQIADSVDKKGVDNAIVQYQFELADKDEENCFKDLYDTLNEFF